MSAVAPPTGVPSAAGGGVRVQAIVQGGGPQGLLITTAAGRFLAGGLPELPTGARLTLQVPAQGARPGEPQQARLVTIDGRSSPRPVTLTPAPPVAGTPAAGPATPRPAAGPAAPPQTAPVPGARPAPPQPGAQPAASHAAPSQTAPSQATPPQPAGAPVPAGRPAASAPAGLQTVNVQPTGAPAGGGSATVARPAGAPSIGTVPSGPQSGPAPAASPALPPAAGLVTTLRLVGVDSPAVPVRVLPTPDGGLPAEVRGRDAIGRLLLQAAGLTLRLDTPAIGLPADARVGLVLPRGLPEPQRPGDGQRPADPASRLIAALAGLDGAEAAELRRVLPRPDARMAARLLGLVQVLRGAAEPPKDAGPGLRETLAELGRVAREPLAGGWKMLLLPVLVEDEVEALRLWHRDRPEPEGGTRSVLELELSHLGRVQLDMLCRPGRLDVTLRSEAALPDDLGAPLAALFQGACHAAGLAGGLRLAQGTLAPLPDTAPADLTV